MNFHLCSCLVVVCDHFHSYGWVPHLPYAVFERLEAITDFFYVQGGSRRGSRWKKEIVSEREKKNMGEEKGIVSKKETSNNGFWSWKMEDPIPVLGHVTKMENLLASQ